jgi:hypothetical protein
MVFPDSIEVAAGLVFVYLIMSVLTTMAREAYEGFVKSRPKHLERGLIELLCDESHQKGTQKKDIAKSSNERLAILKDFYEHPLIMSLFRGSYVLPGKRTFWQGKKLPSYIPSSHFAYVVLDILSDRSGQATSGAFNPDDILAASRNLPNKRMGKIVQFAINNSGGDIDKARQFLESWFNATMDRASGWYKHETQTIVFWSSLIMCIIFNINTVVIAESLYRDPTIRKVAVASAESYFEYKNMGPQAADPQAADPQAPNPQAGASAPFKASSPSPESSAPDNTTETAQVGTTATPVTTNEVAVAEPLPVLEVNATDPVASKVATSLIANVQNLSDRTDALANIGLPLGWNDNTLAVMKRLFKFQQPNAAPHAEKPETFVARPRGLFPDMAVFADWVGVTFRSYAGQAVAIYNGQQVLGDNTLVNFLALISLFSGWVMTAFAVTLGAPFWFDVLGKLMVVRSTIKPKDGSSSSNGNIDIGALAAAFSAQPGHASTASSLTSFAPASNLSNKSLTDTSVGIATSTKISDDDLLFLQGLDPYARPRED